MKVVEIAGSTRTAGPPDDWDEEKFGVCAPVSILDVTDENGMPWMATAWEAEPDEVERLQNGNPLYLWVNGVTPPMVKISVGMEKPMMTDGGPMVWSRNLHKTGGETVLQLVASIGGREFTVDGPPVAEVGLLAVREMLRDLVDQLSAAA